MNNKLCEGCVHKDICKYEKAYSNVFDKINQPLTNDEDFRMFPILLNCIHFNPINKDYANFGMR